MNNTFKTLLAASMFSLAGSAYAIQSDVASGKTATLFIQNGSLYCAGTLAAGTCGNNDSGYFDEAQWANIESVYATKSGSTDHAYMEPHYISGADDVASVDAVYFKSAWMTKSGRIFWMGYTTWGKNFDPTEITSLAGATDFSVMGNGTFANDKVFAVIAGNAYVYDFESDTTTFIDGLPGNIVSVDADSTHALFLTATGELYAAGDNTNGQLGSGDYLPTLFNEAVPVVDIDGNPLIGVQKISAGHDLSMAVVDGVPYAWGENRNGSLGIGTNDGSISYNFAAAIETFEGSAVNVSTNGSTLIHGADGNLYGMGWHNAIMGRANLYTVNPTLLVEGGVEELYVNNGDVWFVRHNGEIKGWGGSIYGQHGHGSRTETHSLTGLNFIGAPIDLGQQCSSEIEYVEVEVIKEVPVEVISTIEVIKTVEVPVEVIKEVRVEVPVEVIKYVEVEVIKEVRVEVPVEVIKTVEVPVEVIKYVEVPVEVTKTKIKAEKRGWGYGDKNHNHTGPKGRNNKVK